MDSAKTADLAARIALDLSAAFGKVCRTPSERLDFVRGLLDRVGIDPADLASGAPVPAPASPPLPDKAPELWKGRANSDEGMIDFIARVYAPWLGKGLMRSHILHLDRPLYSGLHRWLNRLPAEERQVQAAALVELGLPSRKQANDQALARHGTPTSAESLGRAVREASPEVRERVRLYDIARRREARRRRAMERTP